MCHGPFFWINLITNTIGDCLTTASLAILQLVYSKSLIAEITGQIIHFFRKERAMSKDSDALKREEERLINERDEKVNQLKLAQEESKRGEVRLQTLRNLRLQLEAQKSQAEEKLKNDAFEEDSQKRQEKASTLKRVNDLRKELETQNGPKNEANSQLELLEAREEFIKEKRDAEKEALRKEISEIKYRRQLIIAKRKEIQSRIDRMTDFLQKNHPEALEGVPDVHQVKCFVMKKQVERKEEEILQETRRILKAIDDECNALRDERDGLDKTLKKEERDEMFGK